MHTCFLFLALFLFAPAAAAQAPVPSSSKPDLEQMEKRLQNKQSEARSLKDKQKELNKELKATRGNLVDMAQDIKSNERKLSALEDRILKLSLEREEIEARLKDDQASIASLILALERIRRVPPEALILKPGAPYETAQTAMLLEDILPQIYERSERLKTDSQRLAEVVEDLRGDQKDLRAQKATLDKDYAQMEKMVAERERMVKSTTANYEERQEEIKVISAQARSLKDLVQRLDEDKQRQATRNVTRSAVYQQPASLPRSGEGQLPISGVIRVSYGETDEIGATSKGIKIEGRPYGLVTAPMGGKVQFAGHFKNYGELIILEHEKGYHTLIAGLERIDIVAEQVLNAGEPIGKLPGRQDGENPLLYFEVRHKGRPVNPATKIANLKS